MKPVTAGKPEVTAPLLGQVVAERYFVEEHLGEGGMGTVYRARHVTLEKKVALKVLHGEFSRKQDLVDRFLQEAKAASRIRNEHVIDITDFGVTGDGYVFFAMEYLEGHDLHSELRNVTNQGELFPWPRAQEIFLQVCEALTAAHNQGIIHRDLKPENIFLVDGTGRDDYVKLLDFGIAKVQSPTGEEGERKLTKTGVLFGTPEYMAPEQARGEKPDHRVDVYAMGCLLFQFLTGTVPFKAESFMAILTQHMVEPVPEISVDLLKRSGAPTGVLGIVEKALAKDREDRFSSIQELAQAVASVGEFGDAPADAPMRGKRSARETALRNRAQRPSQHGNWTGSVRQISDIAEEEEQAEAVAAAELEERTRAKSNLIKGMVAGAILIAGGALGATMLGGGDDESHPQPGLGADVESSPASTTSENQPESPITESTATSSVSPATVAAPQPDKVGMGGNDTTHAADNDTRPAVDKDESKHHEGKARNPQPRASNDDKKPASASSGDPGKDGKPLPKSDAPDEKLGKDGTATPEIKLPDSVEDPKLKDPFGGG